MFQIGDTVLIEDTAETDCTEVAWRFIQSHRKARVIAVRVGTKPGLEHIELALDFGEEFEGAHYCLILDTRSGQFVMANNVSLCFEESRPVPLIEGPHFPAVDYAKLAKVL